MGSLHAVDVESLPQLPFSNFGSDFALVGACARGIDEHNPEVDRANMLTAAWGSMGTYWNRPVVTTLIRPHRYTREFLDAADTFGVSFVPKAYEDALWFIGHHSGRDMPDKVTQAGLHECIVDGIPTVEEATLVLVCKKLYVAPLRADAFVDTDIIPERYPKADFSLQYIGAVLAAYQQ